MCFNSCFFLLSFGWGWGYSYISLCLWLCSLNVTEVEFSFLFIRRPSAKSLLDSPYFPATIKSSYLFLSPLQLLAKDVSRLHYAASFAKQGALKKMGTLAAEMCAPYCLPIVLTPLSDAEAEWAYILLKEFIKCLNSKAVKALVLPAIQKILQASYKLFFLKICLLYSLSFFDFQLIEILISDYRLFSSEGINSPRFICARDMESSW